MQTQKALEMQKLQAEIQKLKVEARKMALETGILPFTAGAALATLIIKLFA